MNYYGKYLKYKHKYIELKNKIGGGKCFKYGLQQHFGECWHDAITMMLFQSDITNSKNEFMSITDDKIHEQYFNLLDLFSPENIKANAYKLPTFIYIYYLKNKSNPDINDKIQTFLDLSKKYMFSQVKRIQNRLKLDIPKYESDYLLTSFRDGKQIYEEDIEQKLRDDLEINKDKLLKFLIDNPDYPMPNKDQFLKKLKMTKEEEDEYMKTSEYETELQKFKTHIEQQYKEKEEYAKQIEMDLPKKEKLGRRTSIRKSIECSIIIGQIFRLFNTIKIKEMTILSHGGNIYESLLTYEILNLYINDSYYIYTDCIYLTKKNLYNKLFDAIENPNLIGIQSNIKYPSDNHIISFYTCGGNELLYDDNLPQPIQSKWKISLYNKLSIMKIQHDNIYYYGDPDILENPLEEISPNLLKYILLNVNLFWKLLCIPLIILLQH